MRHDLQKNIPHPGPFAFAAVLSVLLVITLVAAALHSDIDNPTMITNLLMIATGVAWLYWGLACLIRPKPKTPTPKVPDVRELTRLLQNWRS